MPEVFNRTDVDALLERAASVFEPQGFEEVVRFAAARTGAKGEEIFGEYPESPGGRERPKIYTLDGKPSKWASKKQRAFVMLAIAQGKIKPPYKRTGKLGASLGHEIFITGRGVRIVWGTNRSGAIYVIGEKQARYHEITGWQRLDVQLERNVDPLLGEFTEVLVDEIDKKVNGR